MKCPTLIASKVNLITITLLLIFFLAVSPNTFAQILYENGYFIENNNKRTDCLIKNEDWLKNPSSLKYKIEASNEPLSISIDDLKEFSVTGNKYIRTLTQIDTSSQNLKRLTSSRSPLWCSRELLLKVLVEGKANLYYYDDKDLVLFFFSVDNSPVEQLEYKLYELPFRGDRLSKEVIKNLTFINQLKTKVSCGEVSSRVAVNKIKYSRDFLTDYFIRYNKCSGIETVNYNLVSPKVKRFNLKFTPGLDFSAAKIQHTTGVENDFPTKKLNIRIGIEGEFILPFNKNKWAIFIEPTYQSHKSTDPTEITYSSIELPLGLRHYFHLNENCKLFVNAGIVFDKPIEYTAKLSKTATYKSEELKINLAAGFGLAYKRMSIEGRYYSFRTGLDAYGSYHFDYIKSSIVVGYRIF
ncbi:MAG TPA: outer membrane beta-barrel protein [Chryseolinea sp.]|nr:outer membrane beta-barrel protein [Chryseolinea sp.]